MPNLNPDFRGADEVVKPENAEFGWATDKTEAEAILLERRGEERLQAEMPAQMTFRDEEEPLPAIMEAWNAFQQSKGRFPGSYDWSILDEFVHGSPLVWPNQPIGSCFKGDTLIRMADGSHKPISEVRLFEQVLTAEGNVSHVSATMGRTVNEEIYKVTLWGHVSVEMTSEHPLLTKRGYVAAKELTLEDSVFVPAYCPQSANVLVTSEHVRCNQQLRRSGSKISVGKRSVTVDGKVGVSDRKTISVYRVVPDAIELNEKFGWLIGIALAEGGTDGNKVVFTFHPDEADTLAKKVVDTFKELFDVDAVLAMQYERGKRDENGYRGKGKARTCKVSVHSVVWASLFDSLIGKRPEGKRLHRDIAGGSKAFLAAVLQGWLDGDGYEGAVSGVQGTTVSKQLAFDMLSIANGLGMTTRIQGLQPKVSHGVKNRHKRYDVFVSQKERMHCEQTDTGSWRKVRGIELVEYSGKVYNFEVHGDNSYVADGLAVHNCVIANTLPGWVVKLMYQIVFLGHPMEYIGKDLRGSNNYAPYGPFSYGAARKRVNLRGGDGLFCEGAVETLLKDGVLPCNNPDLIALNKRLGVDRPQDYFEPQNPGVYRQWGDWKYIDEFAKYADYPLESCPYIKSVDELLTALKACDQTFVCSMLAIRKIGQHKDGFAIHGRNPNDQWAHCVLPDALIAGPEFRRADDVRVGDKVYGHDGSIQVVEEVISHDFEGHLATISVVGMPAISVTDEHPVLVYRRARRLAGVRQAVIDGHVLDEPTMQSMYRGDMRYEAAWVMAKDVREGDFMMTPPIVDAVIAPPIALSKELAWLMGFYIGDGNATLNHKIRLTLSLNDPVEKVLQGLAKLGLQGHVAEFETYRIVTAYSTEVANQFLAWFGKTFERRFPSWLIHSEYAEDALEGLIQADGCDYKGRRIVQTVSKSLMLQVCMLVGRLGYRVTMSRRKPGLGGYTNSAEAFTVQWHPGSKRRNADGVVLHKVKSVRLSPYSGRVYNFEVSNTHSFVTDGLAVHNCMQFRGIMVASDGAVFIRFSNESWGAEHMYTVPVSEVDDWFRRRNLTAAAIGKIQGPSSSPPVFGV